MKRAIAIIFLSAFILHVSAQFTWKPRWQKDKTETLVYNYSRLVYEAKEFTHDSISAVIKVRYKSENDSFYFLEWKFDSYFSNASNTGKTTDYMVSSVVKQIAAASPIIVSLHKGNFKIKILNREHLDSLQKAFVADVSATFPHKKDEENDPTGMLDMLVSLHIDDQLYGLISDYYSVYRAKDIKLNTKQDLIKKEEKDKAGNALLAMLGSIDGYSILTDTDPLYYKFSIETKMDFSKLAQGLSEMGNFGDDKDTKKTDKAKSSKTKADTAKSGGGSINEIDVLKTDMLVYRYSLVSDIDMSIMGEKHREIERKMFKKIN